MPDLLQIYHRLLERYGRRNWWPADTPFEVAVGAFLTQNTNWNNVEKAIANLQRAGALNCEVILDLTPEQLQELIRPSGFFRQKSERLQLFCRHLRDRHQGSLERMLQQETAIVRDELLTLKGVGPETADSILLYAGEHLSFVVDAYTRRIFSRIGLLAGTESYDEIREYFMRRLPTEVALYNEYHALIVNHCKEHCRTKPLCNTCPCADLCCYPKELT